MSIKNYDNKKGVIGGPEEAEITPEKNITYPGWEARFLGLRLAELRFFSLVACCT